MLERFDIPLRHNNQINVIMKLKFTIDTLLTLLAGCAALSGLPAYAQYENGPKLVSADPASGTKVESLSEITLTMNMSTADVVNEWGMENVELPAIFGAPADVMATLWYPAEDMTRLRITVSPALTQDGTYEITIPAGYIADSESMEYNQEIKLVYTIGSGSTGDDPVQYDLNYTSIEPGPGTYEALNTITMTFDTEVFPDPEARAYLYTNDMVYKGVKLAARDGNKIDILFEGFDTEGTYELVIDKAQIGDAKWLEAHHTGHANPEFRIKGYKVEAEKIRYTYDFNPIVTPDGSSPVKSLDKISLKFNEAWCAASQDQILVYDSEENTYPLSVSMGESLEEAVLIPAAPIEEDGSYRLVIPQGRFGNPDFEESAGQEGALNPEITVDFEVFTGGSSVSSIAPDDITPIIQGHTLLLTGYGKATVYTIQGIRQIDLGVNGCAAVTLPAGLYIVSTGTATYKINVK